MPAVPHRSLNTHRRQRRTSRWRMPGRPAVRLRRTAHRAARRRTHTPVLRTAPPLVLRTAPLAPRTARHDRKLVAASTRPRTAVVAIIRIRAELS
jgi:hypothetical protein